MLRKIARRIFHHSPAENMQFLRTKLLPSKSKISAVSNNSRNDMLDELLTSSRVGNMLGRALKLRGIKEIILMGDPIVLSGWLQGLVDEGITAHIKQWDWEDTVVPGVIARIPFTNEHWETISKGEGLILLSELLGPFTVIQYLRSKLDYFQPMDDCIDYYLGYKYWPPLSKPPLIALNEIFPLKGKNVIEFGPFDGYQTSGLCSLGANVTAIEARADNVIKTQAALVAAGNKAKIVIDDFHNSAKYGRFDLVFAHGVYYHSVAPFVFLQNLILLSDNIFLGGFCATDELPINDWSTLTHKNELYRVKQYIETTGYTAGINNIAYFFHAEDLMKFFSIQGLKITLLSDEQRVVTAGRFIRFLARRN
ncbi:MAG: class I SAM-dependent methyltransferase [Pseudomonadota bacterium]